MFSFSFFFKQLSSIKKGKFEWIFFLLFVNFYKYLYATSNVFIIVLENKNRRKIFDSQSIVYYATANSILQNKKKYQKISKISKVILSFVTFQKNDYLIM